MIYSSAIPPELRERPQWLCWQPEARQGRVTKVPYAVTGGYAKVNDPATWSSFDDALATGQGVGFVFTPDDPYVGLDLDHVKDSGRIQAWEIVRALDSYTEWSVSGTGLHIFVKATLDKGRRKAGIEMYDRGRYFTVTGQHVVGTPRTIEARQAEVDALIQRMWGYRLQEAHASPPVSHDDKALESALTKGPNGYTFIDLFYWGHLGRYDGDCSRALAALATVVAKMTRDPEQIDRLIRASALYKVSEAKRVKWDTARGMSTWGANLIQQVLVWTA